MFDFLLKLLLIILSLNRTKQSRLTLPSVHSLPVRFVIASDGESHARACIRNRLYPTSRIVTMEWNVSALSSIAINNLQKTITPINNGIKGCCGKGMWCNKDTNECFTGSYGEYFENFGWLNVDSNFLNYPVYSCYSDNNNNNNAFLFPSSLYLNDKLIDFTPSELSHAGELTVYGENFGYDDKTIELEIGPQKCSNVEVCGNTCRQCSSSSSCPPDSLCVVLYDGQRTMSHCLQYCSGHMDKSCPCDTHCDILTLQDAGNGIIYDLPLCIPAEGADTCLDWLGGDAYNTLGDPSKFTCTLNTATRPAAQYYTSGGMVDMDIGITQAYVDVDSYPYTDDDSNPKIQIPIGVANSIPSEPLQQNVYKDYKTIISCLSDDQCTDNDACTVHKCITGYCKLETIIDVEKNVSCHSTSRSHLDRNLHHAYLAFRAKGNGVTTMLNRMKADFMRLDTKQGDDKVIHPNFKNTPIFFGNQVPSVSFHAGYIALSPVKSCVNHANQVGPGCQAYFSDSNTIGFFMDYFERNHPDLDYYTYTPSIGDVTNESNAPDYLNDSASLFMGMTFRDSDSSSTTHVEASASLFSDGGVRIAYKDTSGILKSRNFNYFGLWGSKQHSLEPYQQQSRKNKETIRVEDIEDDTVFVWCPIDKGIVCLPSSCAQANQNLIMKWIGSIPKCKAVGELEWKCHWLGVANTHTDVSLTTSATFYTQENDNYVKCGVPMLSNYPYLIQTGQIIVVELRATAIDNDYTPYLDSQVHPSHVVHTLLDDGSNSSEYWNHDTLWQRTLPVASPIMVRYFSSNDTNAYHACLNTQGCSALSHHTGYTCKSCGECAPGATTTSSQKSSYRNYEGIYASHITDCNNECFGAAYKNPLNDNRCEGGLTGISPTVGNIIHEVYASSQTRPQVVLLLFMLLIFSTFLFVYTYIKARRIIELSLMNRRIVSDEVDDNDAWIIINARREEFQRRRIEALSNNGGNNGREGARTQSSPTGLTNTELEMISIHVWDDKNQSNFNISRPVPSTISAKNPNPNPMGRDRVGVRDKHKMRKHVGERYSEVPQGSDSSSNSSNAEGDEDDGDLELGHAQGRDVAVADTPRNEIDECTICLETFADGDNYRRFPQPCGHYFHVNCIDEWLRQQDFCPLCKRSVRSMVFGTDTQNEY